MGIYELVSEEELEDRVVFRLLYTPERTLLDTILRRAPKKRRLKLYGMKCLYHTRNRWHVYLLDIYYSDGPKKDKLFRCYRGRRFIETSSGFATDFCSVFGPIDPKKRWRH